MTGLPMLTLWQPWASLMALGVKTIETRGPRMRAPKSLIGQRMGIHAGKRRPDGGPIGDYYVEPWYDDVNHVEDCCCEADGVDEPCARRSKSRMVINAVLDVYTNRSRIELPLGAIVATGVLADCVPMVEVALQRPSACIVVVNGSLRHYHDSEFPGRYDDITDQLPYGDYCPGRWAWLYEDVKPTTERCPACWGDPWIPCLDPLSSFYGQPLNLCPTCKGAGHCDPVPAKGKQGIWRWTG